MNENDGEVALTVEVSGDTLKKEILLNVTTRGGSAVGKPVIDN